MNEISLIGRKVRIQTSAPCESWWNDHHDRRADAIMLRDVRAVGTIVQASGARVFVDFPRFVDGFCFSYGHSLAIGDLEFTDRTMTREQYQYAQWRERYIARHERRGCPPDLMRLILDAERDVRPILPPEPGAWVCSALDWKTAGHILDFGTVTKLEIPCVRVYNPMEFVKKHIQVIPLDMLKG